MMAKSFLPLTCWRSLRKTFLEQYYLLHAALGKLYLLEGEYDKSDFYLNKALITYFFSGGERFCEVKIC